MALVDVRVLTGLKYNHLERANVITPSSTDSSFPATQLYDGTPILPFAFSTAGADDLITLDLDQLGGTGNFEGADASNPSAWVDNDAGTGNSEIDTAQFNNGASSLLLSAGNNKAERYKEFSVRAGEKGKLEWAIRGDGTGVARIRLQDRRTLKYWTGSAWTSVATDLDTQTTAAWKAGSSTVTADNFLTQLYQDTTYRVILYNSTASQSAWADDVYYYPGVDVVSIHGHNIEPSISPQLLSSDNNFSSSSTEATATLAPGSFYALLSSYQYHRYWRVKFTGTNSAAIILGELVLGQTTTLLVGYEYRPELGRMWDRVVSDGDAGMKFVYPRGQFPRRTFALKHHFDSDVKMQQARDEVFARSKGDGHPMVLIPDTGYPDVILGRIDRSWTVTRTLTTFYDSNDITAVEMPLLVASP